ncbi:phosphohistidine phosphatase SixA [Candidatus Pantoea edessiphila]|uniref:Phosphohistidine phosphatase SixA n=1 Tax=Candidatus Pantoea edessiphila TaxID=2044610 RepID=A0A2P5SYG5_9GAMM|nr:phosphohistidine phosphatase SixA [Candidatus Pantoea edessiphila]MBK4775490.1 phosphohistidine phosphatase SixA [Pantoea sp. Edef]PPI87381.1 phosphohistidine phosphatase SixA [Candidatus Pantoea edessiphila]
MKIIIMRHGDSVKDLDNDQTRSLTQCGIRESQQIAHWLKKNNVYIEYALSSPYKRAIQTLSNISNILIFNHQIILPELKPNGNPLIVFQYLKKMFNDGIESVLLISHLPFICNLINVIFPKKTLSTFTPASIICVKTFLFTKKSEILWSFSSNGIIKLV